MLKRRGRSGTLPRVLVLCWAASAVTSDGSGAPSVTSRPAVLSASSAASPASPEADAGGLSCGGADMLPLTELGCCSDGLLELAERLSGARARFAWLLSAGCPASPVLAPWAAFAICCGGNRGCAASGGKGDTAAGRAICGNLLSLLPTGFGAGRKGSLRRRAAPVSDRDCLIPVDTVEPLGCAVPSPLSPSPLLLLTPSACGAGCSPGRRVAGLCVCRRVSGPSPEVAPAVGVSSGAGASSDRKVESSSSSDRLLTLSASRAGSKVEVPRHNEEQG